MWWKKTVPHVESVNPYLGVGYTIPEQWTARISNALRSVQLLPPLTQSVYPCAIVLGVYPDMQNMSPEYAISQYVINQTAVAQEFCEHCREFTVHKSGFVYGSVEYTITANDFKRRESHHIVAYDIDGRASVTASACIDFWPHFEQIRDRFVASLIVQRPEMAVSDHIRNQYHP